jgi:hypothetical protein
VTIDESSSSHRPFNSLSDGHATYIGASATVLLMGGSGSYYNLESVQDHFESLESFLISISGITRFLATLMTLTEGRR